MKILITGGLGHIGSFVIKNFTKNKKIKKIFVIDNISNQRFPVLLSMNSSKIRFLYGDTADKKLYKKIPKVNIVLHLASITNAEKSFDIKKEIYKNNFGSFKNIINFCKKNNSKLIHISSTSVYGPQKNIVDEKLEKLFPQSPYAIIKLKEENLLKNQKKVKYISLRFGTISGFSEGMRFHTAVNKFCFNSVMGIKIPIWGKAIKLYRPYLSLSDAQKTLKFVIENNFFPSDIFNILSENKTVREIINIIKKNNQKPKLKFINSRILNQDSYKISKNKIQKFGLNLNSKISKDIKTTLKKLSTKMK
ncbi:MAG: SDR family oxidoreductase [Flavobacteriales bacterium TMED235]|nr:MAG: SDR family oxidoreductase [Flavobacteriales bacterium TMED235]|tara:strand:+ start:4586 stop:5503 length:918 start_codon:yes stop_codon:yes gene_type:complete